MSTGHLQEKFLAWKFGMFVHFNVATFNDREWASGYEDPLTFAPTGWTAANGRMPRAAGMAYAVLTVKHTGGWCLWDSQYTTQDVTAFTNYKQGKGDIVREFVDAFRERGLKVGLYYCLPGDYSANTLPADEPDLHGLPPEANGDYVGFIQKQLTELLTNYGPIDLIWIDQYNNRYTGRHWREIKAHVKSLQANCIVIANNSDDFQDTDIHGYEYPYLKGARPERALPSEENTKPSEVCDMLGPSWFWGKNRDQTKLQTAEEVAARLKLCNDRHANYLLNVAPDVTGQLPALSVERLREVGKLLGVADAPQK